MCLVISAVSCPGADTHEHWTKEEGGAKREGRGVRGIERGRERQRVREKGRERGEGEREEERER